MEQKFPLSKQESRILNSLSKGRLYKEIASDYSISINTVKKHCKNIYRKLDVHSRAQARSLFLSHNSPEPAGN